MNIAFYGIQLEDFLILGWVTLGPIFLAIVATIVSYFISKRESKFFYHNLNAASILTTLLALYITYEVSFGEARKDAQGGLALFFFPIWTPFIFVISFLASAALYAVFKDDLLNIKKVYLKQYDRLTFFISSYLIFIYFLLSLAISTGWLKNSG